MRGGGGQATKQHKGPLHPTFKICRPFRITNSLHAFQQSISAFWWGHPGCLWSPTCHLSRAINRERNRQSRGCLSWWFLRSRVNTLTLFSLSYNFKMGNGPMLSMNTMTQPAATSNAPYLPLLHAISQQRTEIPGRLGKVGKATSGP